MMASSWPSSALSPRGERRVGARQPGFPSARLQRHLPLCHLQRRTKIALLGPGAWPLGHRVPKVGTEKNLGSMATGSAGRAQLRQQSMRGWLH